MGKYPEFKSWGTPDFTDENPKTSPTMMISQQYVRVCQQIWGAGKSGTQKPLKKIHWGCHQWNSQGGWNDSKLYFTVGPDTLDIIASTL